MTTLTKIEIHNPMVSAISTVQDEQFTFCVDCEENISRFYIESDGDRLGRWSDWKVNL